MGKTDKTSNNPNNNEKTNENTVLIDKLSQNTEIYEAVPAPSIDTNKSVDSNSNNSSNSNNNNNEAGNPSNTNHNSNDDLDRIIENRKNTQNIYEASSVENPTSTNIQVYHTTIENNGNNNVSSIPPPQTQQSVTSATLATNNTAESNVVQGTPEVQQVNEDIPNQAENTNINKTTMNAPNVQTAPVTESKGSVSHFHERLNHEDVNFVPPPSYEEVMTEEMSTNGDGASSSSGQHNHTINNNYGMGPNQPNPTINGQPNPSMNGQPNNYSYNYSYSYGYPPNSMGPSVYPNQYYPNGVSPLMPNSMPYIRRFEPNQPESINNVNYFICNYNNYSDMIREQGINIGSLGARVKVLDHISSKNLCQSNIGQTVIDIRGSRIQLGESTITIDSNIGKTFIIVPKFMCITIEDQYVIGKIYDYRPNKIPLNDAIYMNIPIVHIIIKNNIGDTIILEKSFNDTYTNSSLNDDFKQLRREPANQRKEKRKEKRNERKFCRNKNRDRRNSDSKNDNDSENNDDSKKNDKNDNDNKNNNNNGGIFNFSQFMNSLKTNFDTLVNISKEQTKQNMAYGAQMAQNSYQQQNHPQLNGIPPPPPPLFNPAMNGIRPPPPLPFGSVPHAPFVPSVNGEQSQVPYGPAVNGVQSQVPYGPSVNRAQAYGNIYPSTSTSTSNNNLNEKHQTQYNIDTNEKRKDQSNEQSFSEKSATNSNNLSTSIPPPPFSSNSVIPNSLPPPNYVTNNNINTNQSNSLYPSASTIKK